MMPRWEDQQNLLCAVVVFPIPLLLQETLVLQVGDG